MDAEAVTDSVVGSPQCTCVGGDRDGAGPLGLIVRVP